ncbi:MAG: hypothetical protein ACP5RH_01115 [Leptodesmis sp.]|uniref:hypothetical protein n=1 Tax=Leptodesmis sp. TaxID=3100501 RepID=UPI003D0B54F0
MQIDRAHIILQARTTHRNEYDVQANGQVIGQLRLIDGEWRSFVPTAIAHDEMHEGVNLLLQQWAIREPNPPSVNF